MTKCFHNRNTSHIFNRLIRHCRKRIAVLPHFFFHSLSRHCGHNSKSNGNRHQAQKSEPPIKNKQQCKQSDRCRHCRIFIRQLMCKIGFGRRSGVVYNFAQLSAAETVGKADGQLCNMLGYVNTHICRNAKCRKVRAEQCADID